MNVDADNHTRQDQARLSGRVAVVTGGNRGIGLVITRALAAAGARVAISSRDAASLGRAAAELEAAGVECLAVPCDVADPASADAMAAAVLEHFGHVDVVVANAGIAGPTAPMHEITYEQWRECLAIDLDGVYLTFRGFVPAMIERRQGSLIAISSITGKRPLYGRTPYSAAKMGVIGLVRTLALELGPHGIRVNSVVPGAVDGPRIKEVARNLARARGISEEEALRPFIDTSPLQRLVRPEEVAAACVFLASDAASGITGEDLNVSTGIVMY
jgi:NAD(P)-dependent dehydrogenase (short-subunit alcohol dehydrogenase family)